MASRVLTVRLDALDPARLAGFWAGVLGREVVEGSGNVYLPGEDAKPGIRFVHSGGEKVGLNPMHFHLTSAGDADQRTMVATALRLGAEHLDVGQRPEEGHVVLADPEGNEFCVIESGNAYLAGCGLLGELACDGTREVGLFWSQVLDWPLVWDQDGQSAVQSRHGGTKIGWGGPPVAPRVGKSRQRFELAVLPRDQDAEVERLVALGATRLGADEGETLLMADPDGNEFCVTRGD